MKRNKILWVIITVSLLVKLIFIIYYANNCTKSSIWWHTERDLNYYWSFTEKIKLGIKPGIDFGIEYPSGAISLFWAISLLWPGQVQYYIAFGLMMLIFDIIIAFYLFKICSLDNRTDTIWLLTLYLFCPTILCLNNARFDIIPEALMILAYYYYRKRKFILPAILLGIGISIKWAPVFMFLAIIIYEFSYIKSLARIIKFSLITFSTFALINLPFILIPYIKYGTLENPIYFYKFQANRPIYFDTMISIIRWFINPYYQPTIGPYIITVSLIILISLFHPPKEIVGKYVLYCFAFLYYNRTHSPQFHIWFYPFLLLCIRDGLWPKFSLRIKKIFKTLLGISPLSILGLELLNVIIYPFCTGFVFRVIGEPHPAPLFSFKILVISILLRELLMITMGAHLFFTDFYRNIKDRFLLLKRLRGFLINMYLCYRPIKPRVAT